jgi:hypothetical protein
VDTCKIAPGAYQYTAIDDCTRVRVPVIYPRRTAANSLLFLECVIEEMPFPVQAIQTDRGREFFAYCFQEKLMEYGIKFRPIRPASPRGMWNLAHRGTQGTDVRPISGAVWKFRRSDDLRPHYFQQQNLPRSSFTLACTGTRKEGGRPVPLPSADRRL